jgi:ubiquinone/menaquinone biosynthesis C-methylase UbiE
MSLRTVFDGFVSQPAIYRVQTKLLGRKKLDAQMSAAIKPIATRTPNGIIVDVGGGTAQTRKLWPSEWTYISVDPDERMVEIDDKFPIDRRVGGADELPVDDESADVVLLQNMSHHLEDKIWAASLKEAHRVLKPSGKLVFMDATLSRKRWISRIFWKLDAGHFPRREEVLLEDISRSFSISDVSRFTLVHHVVLVTAIPS